MKRRVFPHHIALVIVAVGFTECPCLAQTNTGRPRLSPEISPAYKEAALKAMLREANEYALRLKLPEKLPIEKASLSEVHISPPAFADRFGGLGSFRTERFSYAFGRGRRLSYITRLARNGQRSLYEANKHLAIAASAVNTNAAYSIATQFLANAFVDLNRLSESTRVSVRAWQILDIVTSKYTIQWERDGKPRAQVTLIEPTKELLVLRIEDPDCIVRQPIDVNVPSGERGVSPEKND